MVRVAFGCKDRLQTTTSHRERCGGALGGCGGDREHSPVRPMRVEEASDWLADEVGVGGPVAALRVAGAGSATVSGRH